MQHLTQFAAEATEKKDIFTSLGIDWQMLILQLVAFLVLVFLLSKWVFPWLIKSVDDRQRNIEEANKAADEARKIAEDSESKMQALLDEAREQAAGIINTARLESAETVSAAQMKAQESAERIVANAHVQIDKDISAAQKALRDQTLELVGLATEKVVGKVNTKSIDNALIAAALKESE